MTYELPASLYPDWEEWQTADYAGRVQLLHLSYESMCSEAHRLQELLDDEIQAKQSK